MRYEKYRGVDTVLDNKCDKTVIHQAENQAFSLCHSCWFNVLQHRGGKVGDSESLPAGTAD